MTIQTIPLNQLMPSTANVRRTGASLGIDELAASIAAHGLLQNLQVRPAKKGRYEVVAGGRRLAALKLLAKAKQVEKDFGVPCHVLDTEDAGEISLAENTVRLAMHPADQFTAFQGLVEQGKGVEEIAARFGVSVAVVRQRLKLAAVSPRLIELYRCDAMSLDQLMAFTVSDDHAAQEAAWFDQPDYNHHPVDIRNHLTSAQVQATDRRVAFIGLETYLEAGGGLNRDLFQPAHGGYLTDPALLDRLVAERFEREAETLRSQGWKWIEIMPRRAYGDRQGYGRVHPTPQPLPEDRQRELDWLRTTYESLIGEQGDEPDDETAAQLDELSTQIEGIEHSALGWRDKDRAIAGVVISIGHDGALDIDAGLVHPDDKARTPSYADSDQPGDATAKPVAALSARLTEQLTAERTAALRALMAENQKVAIACLCHAMALPVFYASYADRSCLTLRFESRNLSQFAAWIAESDALSLIDAGEGYWLTRLPQEVADLFAWCLQQEMTTLIDLISYCTAQSIDAVFTKHDRPQSGRFTHADEVAAALGLDMARWWSPTKDNYLGKVSKALILEAVSEGVSPQAAENLVKLKRDGLIEAAERRLSKSGWLPALLRSPQPVAEDILVEAIAAE